MIEKPRARVVAPLLALFMVCAAFAIMAKPSGADWAGGWNSETAMGEPRTQAVMVGSSDGIVYVIGGVIDAGTYLEVPKVSSYNTSSGDWTDLEPMPRGVRGAAGAMGLDGLIYVFTGFNVSIGVTNETQIYNPATDSWSLGTGVPTGVWEAKAVTGSNGLIYVIGGSLDHNLTQIYNPSTDSWTTGSDMPDPAFAGGAAASGDYIYYAGGCSGDYDATDVVYRYSIFADEWTTLDPMPVARAAHTLEVGPDGLLYLVGGSDSGLNTVGSTASGTLVYDPDDDSWTNGPSLSETRKYHGSAITPLGELFVLGGNALTTERDSVESLRLYLFDYEVELSSSSVRAGNEFLVTVDAQFTYVEEFQTHMYWHLLSEDDTIVSMGSWSNPTPEPVAFEVSVPELAAPGSYTFVIYWWFCQADIVSVTLEDLEYPIEVLPAEPLEDMIAELEDQISELELQLEEMNSSAAADYADLMAELVDLMVELSDMSAALDAMDAATTDEISALQEQVSALEDELSDLRNSINGTQDSVDDVGASVDNKMDGALGLAIIGLLVVVIILMIVMMVMGRKPKTPLPEPPPEPPVG